MQEPKPVDPDSAEADEVRLDFADSVNMTAKELERWLQSDESRSVGQGSGESTGHQSGRRIVKLVDTNEGDLTGRDIAHMKKVNGYVARHLKQRPKGDVEGSDWRYSLMNWGHDPLK